MDEEKEKEKSEGWTKRENEQSEIRDDGWTERTDGGRHG